MLDPEKIELFNWKKEKQDKLRDFQAKWTCEEHQSQIDKSERQRENLKSRKRKRHYLQRSIKFYSCLCNGNYGNYDSIE